MNNQLNKAMTQIIFRCDASQTIGTGHVMRCRTLARQLQERGAEIIFVCRQHSGNLINLLEKEFNVIALTEHKLSSNKNINNDELTGRKMYEAWLGCTQKIDADQTIQALNKLGYNKIRWIIIDHYGIDEQWESHLKNHFRQSVPQLRIAVLDDLADRKHNANIIVDQNYTNKSDYNRYKNLIPDSCIELLGPHYAIMGPEYSTLRALLPKRKYMQRVIVFFGGTDTNSLALKALQALSEQRFAHLAVDVVVSAHSRDYSDITLLARKRHMTTIHSYLPSLACLMVQADLAIGAGGTTTWERACLHLPTLVVSIAENQTAASKALDRSGYVKFMGTHEEITQSDFSNALDLWCQNKLTFVSGDRLTDGYGAHRLATALMGSTNPLYLREADANDEALLLRWANDPTVRAVSLSSDEISIERHRSWFQSSLLNPDRLHWILIDKDKAPLGQIRFDRVPSSSSIRLSFSLDRAVRGHGLAVPFIQIALRSLKKHWGNSLEVYAEVLSTNHASQACFARCGFLPSHDELKGLTIWRRSTEDSTKICHD